MSKGEHNLTAFYLGADYGKPILILVFLIITIGTLIGLLLIATTL